MTSKECEIQLKELIEAWDLDEASLNQTDIEAIKHLMLENQMQHKEISRLKQPTIFIDTQDMEERYGEGLYMDYLKEENQKLKKKYENAVADYEYEKSKNQRAIEILKLCNSQCAKETIKILKEDNKEKVDEKD